MAEQPLISVYFFFWKTHFVKLYLHRMIDEQYLILKISDQVLIEISFSIVRFKFMYFGPKSSVHKIVKDKKN